MVREGGLPCKKGRRKKQRTRKRVGKEGLELLSGAAKKIRQERRLLGQQNQIKRVNLGGIRVMLRKNLTTHFFNLSFSLHSHLHFPTKNNITLHVHISIYIYIYIYPYLYKVISITLKEDICSNYFE